MACLSGARGDGGGHGYHTEKRSNGDARRRAVQLGTAGSDRKHERLEPGWRSCCRSDPAVRVASRRPSNRDRPARRSLGLPRPSPFVSVAPFLRVETVRSATSVTSAHYVIFVFF